MSYYIVTFTDLSFVVDTFQCEFLVDACNNITDFYDVSGVNQINTPGRFILNRIEDLVVNQFPAMRLLAGVDGPYTLNSLVTPNEGTIISDSGGPVTVGMLFSDGCFNEGTKILCLNHKEEEYVPVEQLRKGDIVKTYKYGYRKLEAIGKKCLFNNPENFQKCMYKMEKTETNGLLEDLIVTGGHSILVDDLGEQKELNEKLFGEHKIEDKYLLLAAASKNFVQLTDNNKYTYYHFILENNGKDDMQFGVWANGVLTETMSKRVFNQAGFILL
jgi:hypothetical protein